MNVRVLHNLDSDFWHVYAPGGNDRLQLVDEFEAELTPAGVKLGGFVYPGPTDDEHLLEHVYRIHNAVGGWERNVHLRLRSLSLGDVVDLDGRSYAVDHVGFTRLPN